MVHDPQAASLRRRLATAPRHGAGRPYPAALRREVCQHVAQRYADGVPLADLASTLALPLPTLRRWMVASTPAESPFRPVVVRPEPTPTAPFVLHAPGGLRVEVRDANALIDLLRRWPA